MDACNSHTKGEITNYLNLKFHCFLNTRTLNHTQALNCNSHNYVIMQCTVQQIIIWNICYNYITAVQ
jgi:hypothetical protein